MIAEYTWMIDGSMHERVWNPQTGEVDRDQLAQERWRVSKGRFQVVVGGIPLLDFLDVKNGTMIWNHRVTWDGPDRLRLEATSDMGLTWSDQDMIWSRCEPRSIP
jgi:hypothetical protein